MYFDTLDEPPPNDTPILNPWDTDVKVDQLVNQLMYEIDRYFTAIDDRVEKTEGPLLIAETIAYLKHEAEGWLERVSQRNH